MKVWINDALNAPMTFALTFLILDFIWKFIEKRMYGETKPSLEDSIMLLIFCFMYTIEVMRK